MTSDVRRWMPEMVFRRARNGTVSFLAWSSSRHTLFSNCLLSDCGTNVISGTHKCHFWHMCQFWHVICQHWHVRIWHVSENDILTLFSNCLETVLSIPDMSFLALHCFPLFFCLHSRSSGINRVYEEWGGGCRGKL